MKGCAIEKRLATEHDILSHAALFNFDAILHVLCVHVYCLSLHDVQCIATQQFSYLNHTESAMHIATAAVNGNVLVLYAEG